MDEYLEIWKPVKRMGGVYQISNMGRLASLNNGFHILSNKNRKGGYLSVVLRFGNDTYYTRIHRLVYEAFVGEIPKGYHIHHINHNKQDNRLCNLKLVSPKEHYQEDLDSRNIKGMNYYNQYIRPKAIEQYDLEGNFIASYPNGAAASEATGVCQRNILQVANKEPYNKKGLIRKQAGGYIWKFAD